MGVIIILLLFQISQPRFVDETTLVPNTDTLISQSWMLEDGLPVNTVNSIAQDHLGYIWFTTYDGIVRFDGIDFEIFNHANTTEMPQNRAVFMHVQDNVGIWITLENGGVILIDEAHRFTHFDGSTGFSSSNTTHMMEDQQGNMWFSTFNGLYKYDGSGFFRIINRQTPEQNRISYTYEDKDGSIWVATHDGLIHLTDGEQHVYNININNPDLSNEILRIIRLSTGEFLVNTLSGVYTINDEELVPAPGFEILQGVQSYYFYDDANVTLISSDTGLHRYKNGKLTLLKGNSRTNAIHYWHISKSSDGTIWLISTQGDILTYQNDQLLEIEKEGLIEDFYYNNFFEDRESNIWLATARNGIIRLKKSKVQTIGQPEGLSGNNILGIFEDSQGRKWIGTRDYGLNVIDGERITQYREADIPSRDIVHTINEDHDGNIWVGYYQGGVDRFNESGIQNFDIGFGAGVNDIRSVFVSSDSTIWLGTYGGLVKFDPINQDHTYYTEEHGLGSNLIRYIDEGPDGSLWIGTMSGGVSRFLNGSFTNYTTDDGLASNNIRSVYVDEFDRETIWVGTENNGLSRIRGEEITSAGTNDGLPNHVIHYLKEDHLGWLWMSSNNGIFKIYKQDLNAYLDGESDFFNLIHFDRDDGMRNPEANGAFQKGGLLTSQNTFWFSTQEGVAIIDPEPNQINDIPPTVLIEQVATSAGDVFTGNEFTLDAGTDAFRIDYKALTFVAPEKVRYRYMLEGFDQEWREVDNERSALYTNVPSGDYTFRLLAANNDGVWSEDGVSIAFTLPPVFYKQAWFYLLIVGLIIAGYYPVSRIRYHYLLRQQEKLNEIIEEQTAQIRKEKNEIEEQSKVIRKQAIELEENNKTKDKFFSIIAHDLRNPFQAILGFSELIMMDLDESSPKKLRENLKNINIAAERLLSLVENLLEWASLQTGKIELNPEWVNLSGLLQQMKELMQTAANQKNITLTVAHPESAKIFGDKNMLKTILRNLVSNAIKFTAKNGKVHVELTKNDGYYHISIEDNGIGMPEKIAQNLLRLDSNTSRVGTSSEKGSGLGLIICKEMVGLHDGTISVESEEKVGTRFMVDLPIKSPDINGDIQTNIQSN